MRPSSSGTIPGFAVSRSRLAGRGAASWRPRATRPAGSASVRHAVGDRQAKVPGADFRAPRFDVYRAVSHQIREIFAEYTPLVEPLSLDQAYLDVTENLKAIPATEIAEQIWRESALKPD